MTAKSATRPHAKTIFIACLVGFFACGLAARLFAESPRLGNALYFIAGFCLFAACLAAGAWLFHVCLSGYRQGRLRVIGEWEHETSILTGKPARIVAVVGMAAALLWMLAVGACLAIIVFGRFTA